MFFLLFGSPLSHITLINKISDHSPFELHLLVGVALFQFWVLGWNHRGMETPDIVKEQKVYYIAQY